jgi:hypothetical protein
MIGVIVRPADHDVVREFFELFKTPWEFHRSGQRYEVVLCADAEHSGIVSADLILVYAGERRPGAAEARIQIDGERAGTVLSYRGHRIPLYGKSLTFHAEGIGLRDEASGGSVACVAHTGDTISIRIGYDLFREVRIALTVGQPPARAGLPSVDLHIALLRDLILQSTVAPLVEIPPMPDGYPFIACLTHDIDHPSIRRHTWDHTMFGFLHRAVFGSLLDVARGRAPVRSLLTNWMAALKLPLVHAGIVNDFWYEFDRYLQIEAGLSSTFFVIPFEGDPGRTRWGAAPGRRAARYGARDISDRLQRLMSAGCEIGVHGIDAWRDASRGREELDEVARITGASELGVRMHWLYADEGSPATLEKAGFAYDATNGYNETVGYRAGTTQVFKPLDAIRLLELPLHVMDTALFYPRHLHLSPKDARTRVGSIVAAAVRLGGTVTVNWHDRSIAPERLWGIFYADLVEELKRQHAWFATAGQAVAWFRRRRGAVFEAVSTEFGTLRARVSVAGGEHLPGLRLRIHKMRPARRSGAFAARAADDYIDIAFNSSIDAQIPLSEQRAAAPLPSR